MTLKEVLALSDEKLRTKVAELAGWRINTGIHGYPPAWGRWPQEGCFKCAIEIPDYIKDLNAMHELEIALIDGTEFNYPSKFGDYCNKIMDVCEYGCNISLRDGYLAIATAKQRAIAYVLMMQEQK